MLTALDATCRAVWQQEWQTWRISRKVRTVFAVMLGQRYSFRRGIHPVWCPLLHHARLYRSCWRRASRPPWAPSSLTWIASLA